MYIFDAGNWSEETLLPLKINLTEAVCRNLILVMMRALADYLFGGKLIFA